MPKVAEFHSSKPGTEKYHNNSKCWDGNNIEARYWTAGKGGLKLCDTCSGLNAEGK
jgi:hypothetical protein